MIAAFARFDLLSWFARKQTLLTLLFVVVVGVVLPVPGMAILAAALVTSLMVSAPFLGDEKGRLDTLYGLLPIARSTVVIGRVIALVTYYLSAAALATAVTLVMAAVRGDQVAPGILLIAHAAAAAIVGLSLALQLPVFFRIGYSRGRLMAYAPAFVVAGGAWLGQATGMLAPLQQALASTPVEVMVLVGILIGIVGIVIATALAARMYRGRAL
ncbi:ABC-2 transporter permease [Agrococcus sp. ARC_14]|uniref:ABC-2 transporter permease n=1 Tax=Agrococcus sp. ARC_14 TaxID=2919927 RepID=UPI001F063138|nr:ABC-2 transporter permease [Agrococcus sp. ARC_14]MCH1883348.1 ABC-2 transporter permease [Agrococcus sp. ARC_14]